jgi:hypothetical protein
MASIWKTIVFYIYTGESYLGRSAGRKSYYIIIRRSRIRGTSTKLLPRVEASQGLLS